MAINSVIHTNEQSIDRVLKAGLPVALAFWAKAQPLGAAWERALDSAAAQYAGRLLIAKVDTAAEQNVRQRYSVPTVPALVLTKAGEVVATLDSQSSSSDLAAWLRYLAEGGTAPAKTAQRTPTTAKGASATGDGKPITLTDSNFEQITKGSTPILVDFWAPWCGPCRMVAPAVEEVAKVFQGRALVGKLNVDENPLTAQRYQIMGIPALYIFKDGKVVEQMMGVQPAAVLQQRLAQHTT
jgi:thioredoxin 1